MDVINLAATALFEAFDEKGIERARLLEGTSLNLAHFKNRNKRFSWSDFIKMYENSIKYLGYDQAIKQIAYHGTYNNDLTIFRKVGFGFITAKSAYRFLVHFVLKLFYKDSLICEYKSIGNKEIEVILTVKSGFDKCPGLFDTYIYVFEGIPKTLGLPEARVKMINEGRRAIYQIKFDNINYFSYFFKTIFKVYSGYNNSVELLREIEVKGQKLESTLDEKKLLIKIISHDIANHVQLINMYLDKAEELSAEYPEVHNKILGAVRSKNKLNEILNNVRLLERGEMEFNQNSMVQIPQILQNLKEDFSLKCSAKNIELKIVFPKDEILFVTGNEIALEVNILGNLLSNAIKFSYPNSKIVLDVKCDHDFVYLSVIDYGVGIEDLEYMDIFSHKVNKSELGTMGEQGTGFGLGIVKTFIDSIGGKISVQRSSPQGTTFVLTLKRASSVETSLLVAEKIGENKNITSFNNL